MFRFSLLTLPRPPPPRLRVRSSFFLVFTGLKKKKTCCSKWQHGRGEITLRGLIGGELVAEVERESEGPTGGKKLLTSSSRIRA